MIPTITTVQRRDFIAHQVYIARCGRCRWRAELRELSTAVALVRAHVCQGEAA